MSSPVVVLTGPPGAGKSRVARVVADALHPSVRLHTDDFSPYIRRGRIAPYRAEARRQNEIVMDVVVGAAFGYAAGGYHVIVDGVVGPWFIEPFRAASRASGHPLHYAVLRPDEATTLRRATNRTGDDALTDAEPVRRMHRQFGDLTALERHAIDTTRLAAEHTATLVLRGIDEGSFLLAP
jgi:predicted kinase